MFLFWLLCGGCYVVMLNPFRQWPKSNKCCQDMKYYRLFRQLIPSPELHQPQGKCKVMLTQLDMYLVTGASDPQRLVFEI